tara:strand:+ start:814 stop:1026 length:213 start_codon:yes stop_codon:yes gene_type:complete
MIVLTQDLFDTWAKMFTKLDVFITETLKKHPEMDKYLDRDSIHTAVQATKELADLLETAREVSNERKNKK